MKIKELMSAPGVAVPPQASVRDAARQMAYEGVGSVLVVDDGELVGIVTDRDLALRVVDTAFHTFRRNPVRRLPVVDGADVVGMIAVDDLLVLSHQLQADLLGPIVSELDEPQPASA